MESVFYVIGFLIVIILIMKVLRFHLLSVVYLFISFYSLTIILTVPYFYFYEAKISMYNFDFISESLFLETINFHLLALLCFCIGVFIYYDFSGVKARITLNKSFDNVLKINFSGNSDTLKMIAHAGIFLVVICCMWSYGLEIFYRDTYIPSGNMIIVTAMKLSSLLLTIVLGLLYKQSKWLSLFYFLIIFLIALGTGSRLSVLYIVLYTTLTYLVGKSRSIDKLLLSINFVLSFLFLCFLISLRPLEHHGIIPYMSSLFNSPEALGETIAFNVYYSFIFGIFVTAETITENTAEWNNIYVSLNPLPGKWIGWYEIAPKLRSNIHAPFSFNGEIFTFGRTFTAAFFTILGLIFADLEHKIRCFFQSKRKLIGFLLSFLLILFIMFSFEYNLRSTVRYIYYAYFIILIYNFFGRYKFKMNTAIKSSK
jgi:hypothetical protein